MTVVSDRRAPVLELLAAFDLHAGFAIAREEKSRTVHRQSPANCAA